MERVWTGRGREEKKEKAFSFNSHVISYCAHHHTQTHTYTHAHTRTDHTSRHVLTSRWFPVDFGFSKAASLNCRLTLARYEVKPASLDDSSSFCLLYPSFVSSCFPLFFLFLACVLAFVSGNACNAHTSRNFSCWTYPVFGAIDHWCSLAHSFQLLSERSLQ